MKQIMTLQQMKYFVAAADSGSISVAAKRLYIAQSSVSEAVRTVESHYGIKAFVRTPKGVMLTSDGKELFIEFKGILNRLYYLDLRYEDKKDSSHGFYVATQHHICGMDSFLAIIQSLDVSEYNVGFRECKTSEVFDQVEKGLADLGVIFFAEQLKSQMIQELRGRGIIFNHIAYKTAHIYLHKNHPLAGHSHIRTEEIIQYPFITYDRSTDANPAYTEVIIPHYRMKKVISVTDRAAAYSIMRANNGFVVGSGYHTADRAYDDIRAIPIQDGVNLEIGFIVKGNYILSDMAQRFIELVGEKEA
ncbi:MAG: LysR family transcriptional regulator [Lachnospiraceae bacterium]